MIQNHETLSLSKESSQSVSLLLGVIDLRVVPIPLYLSMLRLAEITGIKDQTLEKWKRYTFELTELVTQAVEFDLTYGNKGKFICALSLQHST